MNRTISLTLGLAAGAVVLASAPAAHAETQTFEDPKGDVAVRPTSKAGQRSFVDVIDSTNTYAGNVLTVTTETSHLYRRGYGIDVLVRTDLITYVGEYDATGPTPVITFFTVPNQGTRQGRQGVACSGLRFKTSERTETVTTRIPSSCFAEDDEIQVGTVTYRYAPSGDQHIDDARREGFPPQGGVELGPVLARD